MSNRTIISIFRLGAANMNNELAPFESVAGESFLDDYRTQNRFPRAHVAKQDMTPIPGQKGYGYNNVFKAFSDRFDPSRTKTGITHRAAAFMTLGTPGATRSHFFEQNRIFGGGVEFSRANSGYFNRFADMIAPQTETPLDLVSLGNASRMTIGLVSLYASTKTVTPLLSLSPVNRAKALMNLPPVSSVNEAAIGRQTQNAMLDTTIGLDALKASIPSTLPSDADGAPKYTGGWGARMRDAIRMKAAGIPSRVICVDFDGWDHHSLMGGSINSPSTGVKHRELFQQFNDGLVAAMYDLEQLGLANDVMICSQTEFHRTQRENGNQGADHGQSQHAYVFGPTVQSDLYGKVLDFRENNAQTYADPGSWQSPFPNRLLKHTMDYRDYQRMQCEWLAGREFTPSEVTQMWGSTFTSNMTPAQRASIPFN